MLRSSLAMISACNMADMMIWLCSIDLIARSKAKVKVKVRSSKLGPMQGTEKNRKMPYTK